MEIKFRGKRIDNGKWVYGDLRQIEDRRYILDYDFGDNGVSDIVRLFNIAFEVDPATVGQYTGLKDKNGVEIYEGDIIKYRFKSLTGDEKINRERISKVFWQEFRATWAVADGKHCNSDLFQYVQNGNVVEVVGNIYTNPELLGGASCGD